MGIRSRVKKSLLNLVPSDSDHPMVAPLQMRRQSDVAALIHTCDAYEFCWAGWQFHFSRHWNAEHNCNVYFANESKRCHFPGVIHLPTGEGSWADRLSTALQVLAEDYVFYLQEDFWPTRPVQLDRYYQIARTLAADALRITADSPYYTTYRPFDVGGISVRRFSRSSRYLVTHAASLWKRDFLLSCLEKGESPWENELRGTQRLRQRNANLFLCVDDWYEPTCRQGQLTPIGVSMDREAADSVTAVA